MGAPLLASPTSGGEARLWPALHTEQEPPCLSACYQRTQCPRQAAPKAVRFRIFHDQAEASAQLAEAMKCVISVNEGGELQRAGKQTVTVTLGSPSRHLQKAIEILLAAITAAKKAGVDAAEQEAAQLWLKDLQEAEAKVRSHGQIVLPCPGR